MRTASIFGLLAVSGLILATPSIACRFWGLVGGDYPPDLIADQMVDGTTASLLQLADTYRNGWGIAYFLPPEQTLPLKGPLCRRGGPPANHHGEPEFGLAVEEMELIRPKAALAHIRRCSTTPCGVPDPHPLQHEGMVFAHNGTIPDSILINLLTGDDPDYLDENPLDYSGDFLDSELYFHYLLKYAHKHPEISRAEALRRAVGGLAGLTTGRLNFVLTAGDTLFALRCARSDTGDPVRYYPASRPLSPYWIAASTTLGSHPRAWADLPARSLAVFVPGPPPQFLSIDADTTGTSGIGEPPAPAAIGSARPNPASASVSIPISAANGEAPASIEVWDSQGRMIWRDGRRWVGTGPQALVWETRDQAGRAVAPGIYFCRVRVAETFREQRVVIVR